MKLFSYFVLANTRNPLKQGISRNHNPSNKFHSTREFNPQAERESKASQDLMRPRSFPWGVNE